MMKHCRMKIQNIVKYECLFSESLSSIITKLPARIKLILSQINHASNCFSKNNCNF